MCVSAQKTLLRVVQLMHTVHTRCSSIHSFRVNVNINRTIGLLIFCCEDRKIGNKIQRKERNGKEEKNRKRMEKMREAKRREEKKITSMCMKLFSLRHLMVFIYFLFALLHSYSFILLFRFLLFRLAMSDLYIVNLFLRSLFLLFHSHIQTYTHIYTNLRCSDIDQR